MCSITSVTAEFMTVGNASCCAERVRQWLKHAQRVTGQFTPRDDYQEGFHMAC